MGRLPQQARQETAARDLTGRRREETQQRGVVADARGRLEQAADEERTCAETELAARLLPGAEGADERCVVRADGAGRENPAGRCCGGVFIGEVPVVVGMVPVVSVDDLGDCGAGSGFVDEVLA